MCQNRYSLGDNASNQFSLEKQGELDQIFRRWRLGRQLSECQRWNFFPDFPKKGPSRPILTRLDRYTSGVDVGSVDKWVVSRGMIYLQGRHSVRKRGNELYGDLVSFFHSNQVSLVFFREPSSPHAPWGAFSLITDSQCFLRKS